MYVRPHKWVKVNSMMRLKLFFHIIYQRAASITSKNEYTFSYPVKKQQHPVYRFRNIISIFAGNRSKA